LKKNGTPIPYTNVLDTGSEVSGGQTYLLGGARYFDFSIQDEHGNYATQMRRRRQAADLDARTHQVFGRDSSRLPDPRLQSHVPLLESHSQAPHLGHRLRLPARREESSPRTGYTCNVLARSRAGLGRIARVTMPRFPG
jgi:hypothetical protein